MRIQVDRRLSDLAGTGLVLIGFLLVAMAVSATPTLLRSLSGHAAPSPPVTAGSPHAGRTALS